MGNLLHHVEAFGDAAEGGEFAIEGGLGKEADEELRAVAIGLVGDADGGDHAALVFEITEFGGEQVKAAGSPEVARGFGVFEQGVAALNDAIGHYAKERAAIVVAVAGKFEELLYVVGGLVGGEFEAETAQVGGHHRLQLRRGLAPGGEGKKKRNEVEKTHFRFMVTSTHRGALSRAALRLWRSGPVQSDG